jgi:Tfp pilus assembly protein PilX
MTINALKIRKQNGAVSLILTILVLAGILVIALAGVGIIIKQIQMSRQIGESARVYQVADSGIEYALFRISNPLNDPVIPNGALCSSCSGNWASCPLVEDYIPAVVGNYCLEVAPFNQPGKITSVTSTAKIGNLRRSVKVDSP